MKLVVLMFVLATAGCGAAAVTEQTADARDDCSIDQTFQTSASGGETSGGMGPTGPSARSSSAVAAGRQEARCRDSARVVQVGGAGATAGRETQPTHQ